MVTQLNDKPMTSVNEFRRHVRRSVLGDEQRVLDLLDRTRRPVLVGLCAYGFASLLVRLLESMVVLHAVGVAWPIWDLLFLFFGAAAAGGALVLEKTRR